MVSVLLISKDYSGHYNKVPVSVYHTRFSLNLIVSLNDEYVSQAG